MRISKYSRVNKTCHIFVVKGTYTNDIFDIAILKKVSCVYKDVINCLRSNYSYIKRCAHTHV